MNDSAPTPKRLFTTKPKFEPLRLTDTCDGIHPTFQHTYQRRTTHYEEQVWRYLVIEVATQQIIPNGQTDNDQYAYDLCMAHPRPACVKKVLTDEILHRNF